MAQLIFATQNDNDASTGTRWHKEGRRVQARGGARGICSALTAVWIKESIARGPAGVTTRQQLGKQHHLAIVQGAFMMPHFSGRRLLESQGLTIFKEMTGTSIATLVCSNLVPILGHTFFAIGDPATKKGHAMGVRNHADGHDFFDPNEGLLRCASRYEFQTTILARLQGPYAAFLKVWQVFWVDDSTVG